MNNPQSIWGVGGPTIRGYATHNNYSALKELKQNPALKELNVNNPRSIRG